MESNAFRAAVLRLLGLTDLNPLSPTAGCCDRNFWHYQDGKGFPVGSFQSAMLGFAVASEVFPADKEVFAHARDLALQFWTKKIQEGKALSEYYLGQESFCATAHTSLAAVFLLATRHRKKETLNPETLKCVLIALKWLETPKFRPDSANQTLAAKVAWDLATEIPALKRELNGENPFYPKRSNEGWFSEYQGFDLAYSLLCLDLCAMALGALEDEAKREVYRKYAQELIDFIHLAVVSYTFSSSLSSRGNPHHLVGGLTSFAKAGSRKAEEILSKLEGLKGPALVKAIHSDDKYLAFFHIPSLVVRELAIRPLTSFFPFSLAPFVDTSSEPVLPTLELKEAQLYFQRREGTRLAVNFKNGGSVQIETLDRQQKWGGYLLKKSGRTWCTLLTPVHSKVSENEITLELFATPLSKKALIVQNPFFRFTLFLAMTVRWLKAPMNRWIFKAVVSKPAKTLKLGTRVIRIEKSFIEIADKLTVTGGEIYRVTDWFRTDAHSTRQYSNPSVSFEKVSSPTQTLRVELELSSFTSKLRPEQEVSL